MFDVCLIKVKNMLDLHLSMFSSVSFSISNRDSTSVLLLRDCLREVPQWLEVAGNSFKLSFIGLSSLTKLSFISFCVSVIGSRTTFLLYSKK